MKPPPHARRRTGALVALVLAGATLATAPPAALADPTYPATPTTVVDGGAQTFLGPPAIAVDSDDRTTVVYQKSVPNQVGSPVLNAVRVAADGTVGEPQPIHTASHGFASIDVDIDSQGNAVIVWERWLGNSNYLVEYARITSGGSISAPVRLTDENKIGNSPRVAIDSQDRAHIVWSENHGVVRIRTAMLGANGAMAVSPHFISPAGLTSAGAQLAIDGDDAVTVAWRTNDATHYYVQSTRLAAGGAWDEDVETLAGPALFASPPSVASGPDGRSTVVWTQRVAQGDVVTAEAVRLGADGEPLGASQTISSTGIGSDPPLVEIDGRDRSVIVWTSAAQVKSRRMLADGTLEALQHVTPSGVPSINPDLAIDSSNRTVLTWIEGNASDSSDRTVRTLRLGNDGVPEGEALTLSTFEAIRPVVEIGSDDRPVIAWQRDANPTGDVTDDRIELIVGATTPDPDDGDPGDGDPGDGDPGDGDGGGTGDPGDDGPGDGGPGDSGPGTGEPGAPTGPTTPVRPPPTPPIAPTPAAPTGQTTTLGRRQPGKPLQVRVISTADGFVEVSATQIVSFRNGRAASAARTRTLRLKLKRVRKPVRAGQAVTLVLRPASRRQARRISRAAKRSGARATATVKIVFVDRAGKRGTKTLRLKLR